VSTAQTLKLNSTGLEINSLDLEILHDYSRAAQKILEQQAMLLGNSISRSADQKSK